MAIKHLVFTGGGLHAVLRCLSAYQVLEKNKHILYDNLESIYGTSAGTVVAILICLQNDWDEVNTYLIERPWENLFNITVQKIMDLYSRKGFFDKTEISKIFKPLFEINDLSLDISLLDFYRFSQKEIHFFTLELNKFELIDVSHITHPNLNLFEAVQMSCGLPILVTPVINNNNIYIDGGYICNYSIEYCLKSGKKSEEIFGFKNKLNNSTSSYDDDSFNFIDYIMHLINSLINGLSKDKTTSTIENEIVFEVETFNYNMLKQALQSKELRKQLFDEGKIIAEKYLENK
jgi:predicted acylesterase/phospholipase RssA